MNSHGNADRAVQLARANRIATGLSRARDAFRLAGQTLWPVFDLGLRLWLAHGFWISGLLKVARWDTALTLAAYEYPVTWLDPVTAATLGAAIEIVCPILLTLGLATRLAAIPLLVLSLIIQFEYKLLNEHVYWAVLFAWYAVMGAGPLSLDRMLSAGFADSALPFARALSRGVAVFRRWAGPLYQLALRAWLALILAAPSLPVLSAVALFGYRYSVTLLPPGSPGYLGVVLVILCPIMLALGMATRMFAAFAVLILFSTFGSPGLTELTRIDYLYCMLLLGLVMLQGAGPLSLDHGLAQALRRRFPQMEGKPTAPLDQLPQVIIVGAGFGGLCAARGLRHAPCRVTLVDAHNYHLFQPLLYQVATASLSPADVAAPIRGSFRDQFNARVLLGKVTGVDRETQRVVLADGRRLSYDYLVLATGARHAYFGREEWEGLAPGLKQIDDATRIRRRLLVAFEEAENAADPRVQQQWLTFVIVGGGPTGVELAGAIAELARHGMAREFRNIDPAAARVVLVQSAPRILPTFSEPLSAFAEQTLKKLGVEIFTNNRVEDVDEGGVIVSGRRLEARTVFWAAGVMASPAAQWLAAEADSAGRLKVGLDLRAPGLPNVYAIGDTALSQGWNGKAVPGLAPAAKQGGAYVARHIRARIEGRALPGPFRYTHLGGLATIGRQAAVADFGWLRLKGAFAWWFWGAVHILFLVGARSRLMVAVQWFWAYLTFQRSTRLITGGEAMH